MHAEAFVVAGAPGAGKSTVAQLLLELLRPVPALLDKDTLYGPFVAATLRAAGRDPGEREGPWYDEHVKPFEYGALAATAAEIRRHGCPVLLSAPFTGQIHNADQWAGFYEALGGGTVELIWVRSDEATLRERITARGHARDTGKLQRWESFLAGVRIGSVPPVPHHVIDTRIGAPALSTQIQDLATVLAVQPLPEAL
ncbi:AAA family ATPase [Longispora albida]|uniref:AAA family ATPase n=1 Tax=Longispora albida TaxID=203523 RepID=UPI0003824159|nr:AAA family ATPase [Longispora albida]